MIILLLLLLLHGTGQEYIYNSRPVPKAEILDEVLSKIVNRSDYTGSLFSYLTGNEDFGDPDNLDVCVLDANNVFKIISKAKKQYEPLFRRTNQEALSENPRLVARALDLMQQSIYATRFRLELTKRYRKAFTDDARFHIAVLYGALMQVTVKMESLYSIMQKLPKKTHLIWYVILYEKVLAAHVDVHNLVDRIFDLHHKLIDQNESGKKGIPLVPLLQKISTDSTRNRSRATVETFTQKYIAERNDTGEDAALPGYDDVTPSPTLEY